MIMTKPTNERLKPRKRPENYRSLLTTANAKTVKGESLGYYTGILYLSPANESGVINTCGSASPECINLCLKSSGRMPMNIASRIAKTIFMVENREAFLQSLRFDIEGIIAKACQLGLKPAVRLNGTSDLPWIAMLLCQEYPQVMFYDYTKHPKPELRLRPNYWITFSHSGHNLAECLRVLALGVNVAVVFRVKDSQPLPETWHGRQVIDGTTHDLRFLDNVGVVVGLRPKGKAKKAPLDSPFVVLTESTHGCTMAA